TAKTRINDADGHSWDFQFGSGTSDQVVAAPNDLGWALVTDRVTRTNYVASVDDPFTFVPQTVVYQYSSDINGNLIDVTDVNKNHVHFEYDSHLDSKIAPYNGTSIFGSLFGTYYAIYGQPSRSILDYDDIGSDDPDRDDTDEFDSLNLATRYR